MCLDLNKINDLEKNLNILNVNLYKKDKLIIYLSINIKIRINRFLKDSIIIVISKRFLDKIDKFMHIIR